MSCDKESDSSEMNSPPTAPVNLTPLDAALCQNTDLEFTWSASTDPNGDDILYQIEISENVDFSSIYKTGKTGSTSKVFTLLKGVLYYWRVKATDANNASSEYTSPWQFITEADGDSNYVPYAPSLVAPTNYSQVSDSSINLEWNCSDLDGDDLSYDLYYGQTEATATKESNLNESTFTLSNLVTGTTVFWRVVAHDTQGNSSHGQLWSFTVKF